MALCHWCDAEPHETWCPYYRRAERISSSDPVARAKWAEQSTKDGLPTYITSNTHCLACNAGMDMATGLTGDNKPESGDITVCLLCGHIMSFTADATLRELTDAEARDVADDPDILKIQKIRERLIAEDRARHRKS